MKAAEPCAKNWWIDFIYLNNFIRYDEQCYLVSWYLSTDLQMYLFAPLILIPFTFGPLYGIMSSVLILAVSTAVNVYTVLYHYFPPTDFAYAPTDHRMTTPYSFYTMLMYNAPWIRCQIYIIGILTGFLLQMKKKMKIPWVCIVFQS
uniref:Uncharacterized protein n=1 Tax=Panagrolaimus superbus TaxID=310955 RepID=A0A914YLI7_9BILA